MKETFARLTAWFAAHPKLTCILAGIVGAYAMAPFNIWPLMMLSLSAFVLVMDRQTNPWRGAWCTFYYGMGFFTFGLWWVANALLMDLDDYWWAMGFSVLGLPLLLSICWFIAGWVVVMVSKPGTLARSVLLLSALMLAEYGRAFNLTGFPWSLFGYMWSNLPPIMQLAAIGGAYFVTALTALWGAAPALMYIARGNRRAQVAVGAVALGTFIGGFAYGAVRLAQHPTELRDDVAMVIVQPNITPDEKWVSEEVVDHFKRHVRLSAQGLAVLDGMPEVKRVGIIWPETAIDQALLRSLPEMGASLTRLMDGHAYAATMVSGYWRQDGASSKGPNYYNSVVTMSAPGGQLHIDDMYDKHHLVPFGEFLPMENLLDLTPVVGFAGFRWGPGPRVLQSPVVPPVSPMICFEAIFPWYGKSDGAEWLVNPSNDGWYGDTAGPYQHVAMTRFRAIEQGKPIARSATTGISAMIDAYGRLVQSLPYAEQGVIVSKLPRVVSGGTLYTRLGEIPFFILLAAGFALFLGLRRTR